MWEGLPRERSRRKAGKDKAAAQGLMFNSEQQRLYVIRPNMAAKLCAGTLQVQVFSSSRRIKGWKPLSHT